MVCVVWCESAQWTIEGLRSRLSTRSYSNKYLYAGSVLSMLQTSLTLPVMPYSRISCVLLRRRNNIGELRRTLVLRPKLNHTLTSSMVCGQLATATTNVFRGGTPAKRVALDLETIRDLLRFLRREPNRCAANPCRVIILYIQLGLSGQPYLVQSKRQI